MTYDEALAEAREDALNTLFDCYDEHADELCPKLRLFVKAARENLAAVSPTSGMVTVESKQPSNPR